MAKNEVIITDKVTKTNIQVSPKPSPGNVGVSDNLTSYYAGLSKSWAIKMDGKILGEDYSSKYYATQALESANNAEMNAVRVQNLSDNFDNNYQIYTTELEESKTEAINEINTHAESSIASITAQKDSALNEISLQENSSINNITLTAQAEYDKILQTGIDYKANIDLSNLSNTGTDKLNTSKMYTTGAVSTDAQGYNQLLEMKQNAVKTGVDFIQDGNYRTFGTPTITNYGIASGFSSENYIETLDRIDLTSTFKINCKFSIGNELPSLIYLYSDGYNSSTLRITMNSSGIYFFQGSITKIQGITVETLNKDFELTFEKHSNTEYYIYLYDITNSTVIFDETFTTTTGGDCGNIYLSFGQSLADNNENTLKIDLNAFEVYSNGNLVYKPQPRIEIPYTLSKSGSKIVDAAYRGSVMKIYENEGQAGYYTIDEENENFTLPMGEIYGMVETNKSDIVDIKNNSVKKSGDTMTGTLNVKGAFPIPNYILQYSNMDFDTPPASNSYAAFEFQDKNGERMGRLEYAYLSNGEHKVNIIDKKNSETTTYSALSAGFRADGTPFSSAPTPSSTSNTNEIATTAWVKALPRLVETWESDWFTSPGSSKNISFNLAATGMNATNAPKIFIEMIGKVVTAVSNYTVGDIVYPQFTNYNGSTGSKEEGQSVFFSGSTLTYAQGNSDSWVGTGANGGHGTLRVSNVQIKIILRRFS